MMRILKSIFMVCAVLSITAIVLLLLPRKALAFLCRKNLDHVTTTQFIVAKFNAVVEMYRKMIPPSIVAIIAFETIAKDSTR